MAVKTKISKVSPKNIQIRFLKVNDTFFIYEYFDGAILEEICIQVHQHTYKCRPPTHSINIFIDSQRATSRKLSHQDATHAVTCKEFMVFFRQVGEWLTAGKSNNLHRIPERCYKLINEKNLIYRRTTR